MAIGSDWTLEIVQQECHDVGEFDDYMRSFNTPKKKKSPEELKANRELSVRKFRENALAKREEKEGREQVLAMAQKFSPQGKGLKRRFLQGTGQCSAPMQCAVFGKSALSDWKVGDMIYKWCPVDSPCKKADFKDVTSSYIAASDEWSTEIERIAGFTKKVLSSQAAGVVSGKSLRKNCQAKWTLEGMLASCFESLDLLRVPKMVGNALQLQLGCARGAITQLKVRGGSCQACQWSSKKLGRDATQWYGEAMSNDKKEQWLAGHVTTDDLIQWTTA